VCIITLLATLHCPQGACQANAHAGGVLSGQTVRSCVPDIGQAAPSSGVGLRARCAIIDQRCGSPRRLGPSKGKFGIGVICPLHIGIHIAVAGQAVVVERFGHNRVSGLGAGRQMVPAQGVTPLPMTAPMPQGAWRRHLDAPTCAL